MSLPLDIGPLEQQYLADPCGTSSIPYWKSLKIAVPPHMRILHDRDFDVSLLTDYRDEPYFRLFHDLKKVVHRTAPGTEIVSGAAVGADREFAQLIQACYTDISITAERVKSWRQTPVYCPDLWIFLRERSSGTILAGGIADFDGQIGEMSLEWIQVLPRYRRRGYGEAVVSHLLFTMQNRAAFATVSGRKDNPTNPEGLYRKCGFTGDDIWHVLTRRQQAGDSSASARSAGGRSSEKGVV